MRVRTRNMIAVFDETRAAFTSIRPAQEGGPSDMEFLLTPEEFPEYDVTGARWLGTVHLTAQRQGKQFCMDTGSSKDIRKMKVLYPASEGGRRRAVRIEIAYEGDSGSEHGITGLRLRESFLQTDNGIEWEIAVDNSSADEICLKKLGIPLLMNQYFRGENRFKYDKCVLRHTCVAHHHSYLYWSKSSGNMPVLYLQALGNTKLDHFACEKRDPVFGRKGSMGEAFEGCFFVYPVHEKTQYSHLETSELILKPGERESFRFFIGMADSFKEMEDQLVSNGGFSIQALPGMCVPEGEDVSLLIRSDAVPGVEPQEEGNICLGVEEKQATVPTSDSGCSPVYVATLRFNGCGIRNVWIKKGGTVMKLRFFSMEAPGEIIRKQAEFIARNQYETDETDPCWHGLLMWDMTAKARINASCNPFGPDWFAGGSDETGLVSGLFLSGKNVYRPDEGQIRVLNGYVTDFLEKRLTEQPGYKVHRMVPWFQMFEPWAGRGADDAWRAFNYVHVINTFYNMYLISGNYGYSFLKEPVYYVKQAYCYMRGMFSHWMFPDGEGAARFGNMGERNMALHLADALNREGLEEEAEWVRETVRTKAEYFASQEYPYGSEMPYDSTAFEAVYAYGKTIGDRRVMEMTKDVSCANRGRQPVWYLYGTDLRQMGDSSWNVSYMTQLGAYPVYDWLFGEGEAFGGDKGTGDVACLDLVEMWYASWLAGWSIFNSGGCWSEAPENEGTAGWIVDGDVGRFSGEKAEGGGGPYRNGLVAMSGEGALGFYGALLTAASAVVDHPVLGRYGFGCRIRQEGGAEIIEPTDGLGIRMHHIPGGWSVVLNRDTINRAVWDGTKLTLFLSNLTGDAHKLQLQLTFGKISETKSLWMDGASQTEEFNLIE